MPAMYHGSPVRFTHLRAGSWVTPHKEDAVVFGVPWDSRDLQSYQGDGGRPPKQLKFKRGVELDDHPVYLYRVKGDVKPAATNTGAEYDWNHQVTKDTKVELVDVIPSWKEKLMPFASRRQQRAMYGGHIPGMTKADADEWSKDTSFDKLPERAPKEKGTRRMRTKKAANVFDHLMHGALGGERESFGRRFTGVLGGTALGGAATMALHEVAPGAAHKLLPLLIGAGVIGGNLAVKRMLGEQLVPSHMRRKIAMFNELEEELAGIFKIAAPISLARTGAASFGRADKLLSAAGRNQGRAAAIKAKYTAPGSHRAGDIVKKLQNRASKLTTQADRESRIASVGQALQAKSGL